MTRDETVALFIECESKRVEARIAALAMGKSDEEAERVAHEAAKSHWNGWANEMLSKRLYLESKGVFSLSKRKPRPGWITSESIPNNPETKEWMLQSRTDFTGFTFPPHVTLKSFIFPGVTFFGDYDYAVLSGRTSQSGAIFNQTVFDSCRFCLEARFDQVVFKGQVIFFDTVFYSDVGFSEVSFEKSVSFYETKFNGEVWFGQSSFFNFTTFENCLFQRATSFSGIQCRSTFDLRNSYFSNVPDFVQANFAQAPRLDHLKLASRVEPGGFFRSLISHRANAQDLAARYRALRVIAIQGHDYEDERMALKGELRSKRLMIDKPWHAAFLFGLAYDAFSDFGRSLLRPFLLWFLCIVGFAVYFLGQNPDMASRRKDLHRGGVLGQTISYSRAAWEAAAGKLPVSCISSTLPTGDPEKDSQSGFTGLSEPIRGRTNLVNEALTIAYHNALIVLDSSGDSMHRAYGCLYGIERYGGNPIAYVPRSVAIASGIQKVLSAVFIFLFGLALRNMLKVK
jgi:hypothetical protein